MVRVIEAIPVENYKLKITLDNRKTGYFSVKPFLDKGIFQELKDENYFRLVAVRGRSIFWPNQQDFCADTIEELLGL
ncbi:MAG TPA: DUF2442 domain-containing protein [Chitinispirillaceae bacterium]|nr:DUF2442 domain-containing protein [Chitinispirillaceae bacterium]